MKDNQSFTTGGILGPLMRFSLPVLLALLLQTMYGAADLIIVGRFCSSAQVSAVATGSQLMMTITHLIVGVSMGATVLLGQSIGAGRPQEGGRVVGASIALFAAAGLIVAVAFQFLASPAAALLQAPPEAFDATVAYVRICTAGAVFIVAYNVLGSIFRGIGDANMPLITVAIACVLNIAGDLILVAGLGMGAAGAAAATVFAQLFSVALSFAIVRRRKLPFTVHKSDIAFHRDAVGSILRLGAPIALQDLLVSASFLAITAIVNGLGVTASAGVGVAEKVCGFIMLVPSAFMQAMSAFVAQNVGAGKPRRASRALWCGVGVSLGVGLVMFYATFFHGDAMAGLFARQGEVTAAAADYLKSYAIDCLLVSFLFCFIGYFNGFGKTRFVMLQGIAGAFLVRVPASYLFSRVEPVSLFRVGLATPASTALQILLCVTFFLRLRSTERRGGNETLF